VYTRNRRKQKIKKYERLQCTGTIRHVKLDESEKLVYCMTEQAWFPRLTIYWAQSTLEHISVGFWQARFPCSLSLWQLSFGHCKIYSILNKSLIKMTVEADGVDIVLLRGDKGKNWIIFWRKGTQFMFTHITRPTLVIYL
jgi:hypothetical protein